MFVKFCLYNNNTLGPMFCCASGKDQHKRQQHRPKSYQKLVLEGTKKCKQQNLKLCPAAHCRVSLLLILLNVSFLRVQTCFSKAQFTLTCPRIELVLNVTTHPFHLSSLQPISVTRLTTLNMSNKPPSLLFAKQAKTK